MNVQVGYYFTKLNVKEGVITNISDSGDMVELAIVEEGTESETLIAGNKSNIYLEKLDRHIFNLEGTNVMYARMCSGFYIGAINYLHADVNGSDIGLADVYKKQEIDRLLQGKADTSVIDPKIEGLISKDSEQDEAIAGKVDKVGGKQLSQEDFTTQLKDKLNTLPENAYNKAEIDEKLLNKVDKSGNKQLSDENFTTVLKNKLDGVPSNLSEELQKITQLESRIAELERKMAEYHPVL